MYKTIIVIAMAFVICSLQAQSKKVAMLETIGVTEGISTMVKSMVRGELTKSISVENGYSAFTRTDVDKMASEMKFQSSGMVNDKQRAEIGIMSGADYICISKVSQDGDSYYIEAQLVSVETGEIVNPATSFVSSGGMSAVNKACRVIGRELIYGPGSGGDVKLSAEEIRQEKEEKQRAVKVEKEQLEAKRVQEEYTRKYSLPKTIVINNVKFIIVKSYKIGDDLYIKGTCENLGNQAAMTLSRPDTKMYLSSGARIASSVSLGGSQGQARLSMISGVEIPFVFIFKSIPSSSEHVSALTIETFMPKRGYRESGTFKNLPIN